MRVLIAVNHQRRLQEHRPGEAVDGEIVTPVLVECTEPARCRCDRSWAGLATAGLSTLAEVADRPNMTRAEVRGAIHGLLEAVGWIDDLVQAIEADEIAFDDGECDDPVWLTERMIDDHLAHIEQICDTFPVGTVLSRLGDLVAPTVESRAA
jgi:hypothetical protein